MADLPLGKAALADRKLLADVVKHKEVFFQAAFANYDACLSGKFRLLPDEEALFALREDFQKMIDSGMFTTAPQPFDVIIERLRALEVVINQV